MKQAGYSKRTRVRTPDRYKQTQRPLNGDMVDTKNRGNPQQSVEKYLTLARDASSSGDPVAAENYYQYADHYYRVSLANRIARQPERRTEPSEIIEGQVVQSLVVPESIVTDQPAAIQESETIS